MAVSNQQSVIARLALLGDVESEGGAGVVAMSSQRPGRPLAGSAFAFQRCKRSALPLGPPNHATRLPLLPRAVSVSQQEKVSPWPGLRTVWVGRAALSAHELYTLLKSVSNQCRSIIHIQRAA